MPRSSASDERGHEQGAAYGQEGAAVAFGVTAAAFEFQLAVVDEVDGVVHGQAEEHGDDGHRDDVERNVPEGP